MNWFKENKFLGGLIVVTVLLAGVIAFAGTSTGSTSDEVVEEREAQKADIKKMKGMNPYPTIENVKEKKENLKKMVAKASAMQAQFHTFRPESLDNITVSTFSDRLKKSDAEIRALFEEKSIRIPDQAYLGFENYKDQLPLENATGILAYELGAVDWLFRELADAKVSALVSFNREQLPPELGQDWNPRKTSKKKASNKSKKNRRSKGKKPKKKPVALPTVPVAKRLPMEITFKGSEKSVRQVLQAIANSDKYFFEVRIGRVKNPAPVPNSKGIAKRSSSANSGAAASADDEDDEFSDLVGDSGTEEEPEEEVDDQPISEKILQRVAGHDDIAVFLQLDLLLFEDSQSFPVIK